mmetsp:Transcript_53873/g.126301  ORF Transcript_53873/g.126301 Transcript_53873/m.126301 type:complete len:130 (+) Transcript_53873:68-457(+)
MSSLEHVHEKNRRGRMEQAEIHLLSNSKEFKLVHGKPTRAHPPPNTGLDGGDCMPPPERMIGGTKLPAPGAIFLSACACHAFRAALATPPCTRAVCGRCAPLRGECGGLSRRRCCVCVACGEAPTAAAL